jgi:hypothetical protein
VERQPAIDKQPVRVLPVLVLPVLVLVLVPVLPLEAGWLALLVQEAQPPVRPDLGSNPPQVPR